MGNTACIFGGRIIYVMEEGVDFSFHVGFSRLGFVKIQFKEKVKLVAGLGSGGRW